MQSFRPFRRETPSARMLLATLTALILWLAALPASAQNNAILLLISRDTPIYQQVTRQLQAQLSDLAAPMEVRFAKQFDPAGVSGRYGLVVAVGTAATQAALDLPESQPVLSTFIPRRTFEALIGENPRLQDKLRARTLSALYLEQPFQRQLKLLSLLQPQTRVVGSILGPVSQSEQGPLKTAASRYGWRMNLHELQPQGNPIEQLAPVIAESDAFLAIPDKAVFNRSTAKWILLMTFRQRIPLIAYSKRYVDAGALAGVFSTPETVAQETAQRIHRWHRQPSAGLAPASYPTLFEISVNRATARSLRMQLPPLEQLKQRLEEP